LFTQIPIQVYLDRLIDGEFTGTFFEFYPHYFEGIYGRGGNFPVEGLHLWFLLLLFIYSMVALPLFVYFRKEENLPKLSKVALFFKKKGSLYLLIIPGIFIEILKPFPIIGSFGGYNFISLFLFYCIGFLFASSQEEFKKTIENHNKIAWVVGIISTIFIPVILLLLDENQILFWIFGMTYAWSFIIIILGWGSKHLNKNHKSRKFLNEFAMPFYIVHQTIIIIIGYYVVQTTMSIFLKYIIILCTSFIIIVPIVLLIRKINFLRFLFGLGKKKIKKIQS
ncbi:MAG: acyltransferase family protein, partial [archaeon]|nr:acyltransferase family protein [archaeon]